MMNKANKLGNNENNTTAASGENSRQTSYESYSSQERTPDNVSHDELLGSAETFGKISIEDKHSSYVGQSHWTAILENVSL